MEQKTLKYNTQLAKNLKFLRKSRGWSQDELSKRLNINRSNIASYESKNVEPRLRVIMELAKLFDVDIGQLINQDLSNLEDPKVFMNKKELSDMDAGPATSDTQIKRFQEKTKEIKKILEGFKAFYNLRKDQMQSSDRNKKIKNDIESFINLIDHLLEHNDNVLQKIG